MRPSPSIWSAIAVLDNVLPRSARVDILLLLLGEKPAARTLAPSLDRLAVSRWCGEFGFYAAQDEDGFVVLASTAEAAKAILELDRSPVRHEYGLGRQLGYPDCCSMAGSRQSESKLDHWGAVLAGQGFSPPYDLTDPSGYVRGQALISHLPCSTRCEASLSIARRVGQAFLSAEEFICPPDWRLWVEARRDSLDIPRSVSQPT